MASRAALGALVGFAGVVQPAQSWSGPADYCQAVNTSSFRVADGDLLALDVGAVTFACPDGSLHTSSAVQLVLDVQESRLTCRGDEWVCGALAATSAGLWYNAGPLGATPSASLHETDALFERGAGNEAALLESWPRRSSSPPSASAVSVPVPKEEWKQVLIFLVCFLGIGAALEIFMIVCMSRSLTSILRRREVDSESHIPFADAARADETHASSLAPEAHHQPLLAGSRSAAEERPPHARSSIFASTVVPNHAKALVPFFLFVTIGLFVAANTHVGATVELLVKYEFDPPQFPWWKPKPWTKLVGPEFLFQFSLVNTITEMYKAGVYILALLVLVWSGIWPYLKLVLLLVCWFIPPTWLSETTRGRMLLVFDALGKWCMIDIFLMVMMSVAFRFHIDSSSIPYAHWVLPRQLVVLDVTVTSEYGIFGFVGAAMLSLLMNHVVLAYHRTATSRQVSMMIEDEVQSLADACGADQALAFADARAETAEASSSSALNEFAHDPELADRRASSEVAEKRSRRRAFCCPCPTGSWYGVGSDEVAGFGDLVNRKEAIVSHVFRVRDNQSLSIGAWTRIGVVLLLAGSAALTVLGATTESFEFTFTGLAGKAIDLVQPESKVRRYSLVSIARAMDPGSETLDPPNHAGVVFLQTVYLLFALVMPLVQCVFFLALWLVPMRLRDQKIVFDTTEIISSWAALDCFIVSIIAACVEINQFAQFLVGDRCDLIERLAKEPCFGIQTSFLSGCWIVVAAAALLFVASQTVARICERVIHDRELDALQYDGQPRLSVEHREVPAGFVSSLLWHVDT